MFDWLVNLSAIFVFNILGFEKGTHLGDALEFFNYYYLFGYSIKKLFPNRKSKGLYKW